MVFRNAFGVRDGGQRDEADAVGKKCAYLAGHLQSQARLADAANTDEGEQAHLLASEQIGNRGYVLLATD